MSRTEMLREVRMLRGAGALPLATPLLGRRQGLIPGSMVTFRGSVTLPPPGPRSMYSPGFAGFSPWFL